MPVATLLVGGVEIVAIRDVDALGYWSARADSDSSSRARRIFPARQRRLPDRHTYVAACRSARTAEPRSSIFSGSRTTGSGMSTTTGSGAADDP